MGEVMGSHKGVKAIVKDSEHIEFHNMVNPEKFENLEDAKKRQFELVIINHLPQN